MRSKGGGGVGVGGWGGDVTELPRVITRGRKGGIKKSENFPDVLNGWPTYSKTCNIYYVEFVCPSATHKMCFQKVSVLNYVCM